MEDCIFCKIVNGEVSTQKVIETEDFVVIKDVKPSAKTHLLLITKAHISDLKDLSGDLLIKAKDLAIRLQDELNLDEFQFRINWGKLLEVNHMHVHLMAGLYN